MTSLLGIDVGTTGCKVVAVDDQERRALVAELGDEHEMTLPVVNSPRMGVCGYTGGREFDNFDPELISAS